MIIGSFVTCNNIDTSSCLTAINTNQSVHDDILDVNIDSMAEPDSSYENNINNELFTICPRTQLAQWAIKNNISNVAVSDLLKIVNSCYDISIAIDARTLLKTDNSGTNIPLRDVLPGKYITILESQTEFEII